MLKILKVKNFALVESAEIEFAPGFNVLSGETGAGKSILLEAVGFLLGGRASASLVRAGAPGLSVEGVFVADAFPEELRRRLGIGETKLVVKRELDAHGRTRAEWNGRRLPVAELATLGESLVDFQSQNEHQTLLKPSLQLDLLDRYADLEKRRGELRGLYEEWRKIEAERDGARLSAEEREKRLESLRLELSAVEAANLRPGEEAEIESAIPLLKNAEKAAALIDAARSHLSEDEGSAASRVSAALKGLSDLARLEPSFESLAASLEPALAAIQEASRALGGRRDVLSMDPGRLDALHGRLEQISRIAKKYGGVQEALRRAGEISDEIASLENNDRRREELDRRARSARQSLERVADDVHLKRLKASRKLESEVLKELKDLGMPEARFSVAITMDAENLGPSGADAAEFMFSANPGELEKPLRQTASGGELSRVALALKTALSGADGVPILVFDEVDAGVGGTTARAVGRKLLGLSAGRQVLCVTHLPHIASMAQAQFAVRKVREGGRIAVAVERLAGEARVKALAVMLGGEDQSEAGRRHAKELLT